MITVGEKFITVFNEQFNSDEEPWERKGTFLIGLYDRSSEHDKLVISNTLMALCGWEYDSLMQLVEGAAIAPSNDREALAQDKMLIELTDILEREGYTNIEFDYEDETMNDLEAIFYFNAFSDAQCRIQCEILPGRTEVIINDKYITDKHYLELKRVPLVNQGEELEKYYDKVRVICHSCKTEQDNEMLYAENPKYPDDFYIKCKHCSNSEEGNPHLQNFDLVMNYGRFKIVKEEE